MVFRMGHSWGGSLFRRARLGKAREMGESSMKLFGILWEEPQVLLLVPLVLAVLVLLVVLMVLLVLRLQGENWRRCLESLPSVKPPAATTIITATRKGCHLCHLP